VFFWIHNKIAKLKAYLTKSVVVDAVPSSPRTIALVIKASLTKSKRAKEEKRDQVYPAHHVA
jgi:hypothetical protein